MFCGLCGVKNCARRFGEEEEYPECCPSLSDKNGEYLEGYQDPTDRLLAQRSALCAPDHSECRVLKTMRFAKECGYRKLGVAFCISLEEEARVLCLLLKRAGFDVESVVCKVGHWDRKEIGIPSSCNVMCNPIAQAGFLNETGTELNIVLGLCVGHDALFIRHSDAPVTVLATKDHVYDNAPMEYIKQQPDYQVKNRVSSPAKMGSGKGVAP